MFKIGEGSSYKELLKTRQERKEEFKVLKKLIRYWELREKGFVGQFLSSSSERPMNFERCRPWQLVFGEDGDCDEGEDVYFSSSVKKGGSMFLVRGIYLQKGVLHQLFSKKDQEKGKRVKDEDEWENIAPYRYSNFERLSKRNWEKLMLREPVTGGCQWDLDKKNGEEFPTRISSLTSYFCLQSLENGNVIMIPTKCDEFQKMGVLSVEELLVCSNENLREEVSMAIEGERKAILKIVARSIPNIQTLLKEFSLDKKPQKITSFLPFLQQFSSGITSAIEEESLYNIDTRMAKEIEDYFVKSNLNEILMGVYREGNRELARIKRKLKNESEQEALKDCRDF